MIESLAGLLEWQVELENSLPFLGGRQGILPPISVLDVAILDVLILGAIVWMLIEMFADLIWTFRQN